MGGVNYEFFWTASFWNWCTVGFGCSIYMLRVECVRYFFLFKGLKDCVVNCNDE